MQSDVSGLDLNFVAVNFVRVMHLNAKNNGPLEKAVMKRTMEVVTLIESEVYDKDISVQYRHCGDIVYLFLLVYLSYDYFTNFQISRDIYIFSIWFLYVSESALNYLSNDISYTYIYFCCQLAAIMEFSQNLRMLKVDKVALHCFSIVAP